MTFYGCRVADAAFQVFVTEDGIHKTDIGPRHVKPRDAIRFAANVQAGMPVVSPLRSSEEQPGVRPLRPASPQMDREAHHRPHRR